MNHPRGGSSRTIRPSHDKNKKRTPNSGPEGTSDSDWRSRSKFEHIPSISRSSGLERDGDTYVHTRLRFKISVVDVGYRLKNPGIQEEYRKFLQQKVQCCMIAQ